MKEATDLDFKLSAAKELLVIGLLKITLVLLTFAFSTLIVETVRIYILHADNWMTDNSRVVSQKIIDLYQ